MIIKSIEFEDKIEIEPLRRPRPISIEEFTPAEHLFTRPEPGGFKDSLMGEVRRRWKVAEDRRMQGGNNAQRKVKLDKDGVLIMSDTDTTIPVSPVLRPLKASDPNGPKGLFNEIDMPITAMFKRALKQPEPPPKQVTKRRRGRPKKKPVEIKGFAPLVQYRNRFFYMRSILHPYLESYSFDDVGKIMSALWNDYRNCWASDYFSFLTATTYIEPTAIQSQMSFVQLWDYEGAKAFGPDSRAVIMEIVEKQQQMIMEKFNLSAEEVPVQRIEPSYPAIDASSGDHSDDDDGSDVGGDDGSDGDDDDGNNDTDNEVGNDGDGNNDGSGDVISITSDMDFDDDDDDDSDDDIDIDDDVDIDDAVRDEAVALDPNADIGNTARDAYDTRSTYDPYFDPAFNSQFGVFSAFDPNARVFDAAMDETDFSQLTDHL